MKWTSCKVLLSIGTLLSVVCGLFCDESRWSVFQWQTTDNVTDCAGSSSFTSVNISHNYVTTWLECVNLCMMNSVCSDVFYDEQGRMCTLANDVQGCVATNSLRRVTKVNKRRRHESKILICKHVSIR